MTEFYTLEVQIPDNWLSDIKKHKCPIKDCNAKEGISCRHNANSQFVHYQRFLLEFKDLNAFGSFKINIENNIIKIEEL